MDSTNMNPDDSIAARGGTPSIVPEHVHLASGSTASDAPAPEGPERPALAPQDDALALQPAPAASAGSREIAAAVDVLTQIALQLDDPVSALEEGAEALAEALAARDAGIERQDHAAAADAAQANMRRVEFEDAYRHARMHRVGELVDLGYQLDQAVAITNANEADIRKRALAAGRDPAGVIYHYALLHGYLPRSARGWDSHPAREETGPATKARSPDSPGRRFSELEALAAMSDEEFGRVTKGDRWQRLLRGN
ncbi:MAG TPA: hypothetical protein PLR41_03845 [Alphaproteobacteria bacterium]|nr:hypothetical protein [Alphaproteobacteria bacterium]